MKKISYPLLIVLVIGASGTTFFSLFFILFESRNSPQMQMHTLNTNFRQIQDALESFYIDYGVYPSSSSTGSILDASITVNGQSYFLTTPKLYLSLLPLDVYSSGTKKESYRYFSDGKNRYCLLSNGPDGDVDLRNEDIDSALKSGKRIQLRQSLYDPSNGMNSNGDISSVVP